MRFASNSILLASAGAVVAAGRPADTSICDYYTTALLKENTAENQLKLLTLVVNTAVIGNYTMPNVGIMVPGILAPGKFNGTDVNLLPYFNGERKSTNRGGEEGVSVNFLDGGGAEPLKANKAANDEKSNQHFLLTHLYQFFGAVLGCKHYGMAPFSAYSGHASMYSVHKFMDLDQAQLGYFITQVGLSAASFGVDEADVTQAGMALGKLFGFRCSPPATVIKEQGPQLQAVCINPTCPLAPEGEGGCPAYGNKTGEANPSSTSAGGGGMGGGMGGMPHGNMTGTDGMPRPTSTMPTGGAGAVGVSAIAALFAALAL